MLVKSIRLILFALFFVKSFSAYNQTSFQLQYGTPGEDYFLAADNDIYGNTIFVGASEIIEDVYSGLLLKIKPDGSYQTRLISMPDTTVSLINIMVLPGGDYFVLGQMQSANGEEPHKMMVMVLDTAMNTISRKFYALPEKYSGISGHSSILQDNEGNLVLALAHIYYEGTTSREDFAFYKFTIQGDTLMSRVYETMFHADPYHLTKVPNSNNIMLTSTGYLPMTAGELMFLDSNLDILRVTRIRDDFSFKFEGKHWLSDTSFLMAQSHTEHPIGSSTEYMVRVAVVDTSATYHKIIDLNHPDTIEYSSAMDALSYFNDTTIFISGSQSYNNLNFSVPNEAFLYIVDKDLNLRGYKALGDGHYYITWGTHATMDGGCFVWARRFNIPYDVNEADIMIWKVMPEDMTLYTQVSYLPPGRIQGHAWPNPVGDELYVSLEDFVQGETIRYRITDMQGRTCLDMKQTVNGNCLHTQTHNLDPGMYIYEVSGPGNKIISGKFIKQ